MSDLRFLTCKDDITNFIACVYVGKASDPEIGSKVNTAMDYIRRMVARIIDEEKSRTGVTMSDRDDKFKITINDIPEDSTYPTPVIVAMNSNTVQFDIISDIAKEWSDSLEQHGGSAE